MTDAPCHLPLAAGLFGILRAAQLVPGAQDAEAGTGFGAARRDAAPPTPQPVRPEPEIEEDATCC